MLTRMRIFIILLLGLLPAAPVWAHANLTSSTPAAGATVAQAPDKLTLTFSEAIQSISKIELIDPSGTTVQGITTSTSDSTLTAVLPHKLANGTYHVKWTSAAEDGHVEDGEYSFTVGTTSGGGNDAAASGTSAAGQEGWVKGAIAAVVLIVFIVFIAVYFRSQRRK